MSTTAPALMKRGRSIAFGLKQTDGTKRDMVGSQVVYEYLEHCRGQRLMSVNYNFNNNVVVDYLRSVNSVVLGYHCYGARLRGVKMSAFRLSKGTGRLC